MTEEQKRKVSDLRRAGMGYTETATEKLGGLLPGNRLVDETVNDSKYF